MTNKLFDPVELTSRELPTPTDPIADLGKELFFSKSLSFGDDVACASCHDPRLAGTDNLSLPVGVGAHNPDVVGPGRRHDGNFYIDPKADFGPNVPRNSPTTFNIAFYDSAMFWDGRIESVMLDYDRYIRLTPKTENGVDTLIRTPDSFASGPDPLAGANLTEAQARFPVTSTTEMRGFASASGGTTHDSRDLLTQRLIDRGWESYFRDAFNDYVSTSEEIVGYPFIAKALSEYQRSQVALDNPFFDYVAGNDDAISESAKRGATKFFSDLQDGGCYKCHTGPHFTDENFYVLATPQIGRGKNANAKDFGRYNVSRSIMDRHAFRTPSLLNVALTAPYMHAGSLIDLETAIQWHYTPNNSVANYDYSLESLPQFSGLGINTGKYSTNTAEALDSVALQLTSPTRRTKYTKGALDSSEMADMVAFLQTLSSNCLQDFTCVSKWMPDYTTPSVDGHRLDPELLLAFDNSAVFDISVPDVTEVGTGNSPDLGVVPTYQVGGCEVSHVATPVEADIIFQFRKRTNVGFDVERTISSKMLANFYSNYEPVLNTGSAASADLDGDCDLDLVIDSGDVNGVGVYLNDGGVFTLASDNFGLPLIEDLAPVALVDLNGDAWPDLFVGNILGSTPRIWFNDGKGQFIAQTDSGFQVTRKTLSGAFSDVDGDGDLDVFLSHWDIGSPLEEVHLWLNDGKGYFTAAGSEFGFSGQFGERDFTFTPNFADMNGDGLTDLLSAADFLRTQVYQKQVNGSFTNVTDPLVITDENGMGAALGDIDNDGDLDWFISSIYDEEVMSGAEAETEANWGATGNRLYRNDSVPGESIVLSDITDSAGVPNGNWAWGACIKDFNNDGWLDIYQVNGYGYKYDGFDYDLLPLLSDIGISNIEDLMAADYQSADEFVSAVFDSIGDYSEFLTRFGIDFGSDTTLISRLSEFYLAAFAIKNAESKWYEFQNKPAHLFMNNKDGSFHEEAALKQVDDTGEGRGVVCNDFDRDGDIDILIINNTGKPTYYENHHRRVSNIWDNFLNLQLRGDGGNRFAYGAKVYAYTAANIGGDLVGLGELNQYREMRFENNFISNNAPELHFGLAAHSKVDTLRVEWPNGTVTELTDVDANQFMVLQQPAIP